MATSRSQEPLDVTFCESCEFTLDEFIKLSEDDRLLNDFLYNHNVIPRSKRCPKCDSWMNLDEKNGSFRCKKRSLTVDKHNKKANKQCDKGVSQYRSTLFFNHNLSKQQICKFVALWILSAPPRQELLCREIGISTRTCVDWSYLLRDVCVFFVQEKSVDKIGGVGKTVELYEAKVSPPRLNKVRPIEGKWIFGGVERESQRCIFQSVSKKGGDSLLKIVKDNILPGTKLVSDCWKSYKSQKKEFEHLSVNHSVSLVDLEDDLDENGVEGTWREVRVHIMRNDDNKHRVMMGQLAEFMYRRLHPTYELRIHNFFQTISQMFSGEQ